MHTYSREGPLATLLLLLLLLAFYISACVRSSDGACAPCPPAQQESRLLLFPGVSLAVSIDYGDYRHPEGSIALFNSSDELCGAPGAGYSAPAAGGAGGGYSGGYDGCEIWSATEATRAGHEVTIACDNSSSTASRLRSGRVVLAVRMLDRLGPSCDALLDAYWTPLRKFAVS